MVIEELGGSETQDAGITEQSGSALATHERTLPLGAGVTGCSEANAGLETKPFMGEGTPFDVDETCLYTNISTLEVTDLVKDLISPKFEADAILEDQLEDREEMWFLTSGSKDVSSMWPIQDD